MDNSYFDHPIILQNMETTILTKKLSWLKGLALKCPVGDEDANCPFFNIRTYPVGDRMKILDQMEMDEIVEMLDYHEVCLRHKEQKIIQFHK